ncbi:hypothetical protein AcW1_001012 [Taiwanofungus camphoratus]|nr:hypothetical protein AcV5_004918 [Antrodia cinnamomea]KAI0962107.1 hypothetical protein AcV7_001024 [Antrodia cinnamomea]KAI0964115.1 hypothetical protein AcW1_001012 [Antrodia cinnamomea]
MDGRGEPDSEDNLSQVEKGTRAGTPVSRLQDDEDDDKMDSDKAEESGSDTEEDEADQPISASEAEDDEENPSALQDLQQFVTSLDSGQKRKAPDNDNLDGDHIADAARTRKKRLLKERTEAGEENEFAAHVGGSKLKFDDLITPLASQSSNLMSLRKSAKILTSQSGANRTLTAPLPQRTAERLDREAAYEQTREEVDKWKATMQRIKEAEHLSFPLQAQPTGKTSNLELAAKFKPTTELESAVDKLLKSAKMREEDIAQTESLKMNHLSVEEVAARRAELAKMRDLMFRAEAKAKRIAKIKSKTYRRLKKKERVRLAAKIGENDDDDDDDEEMRMRREIDRARERATLRHKNTGKWAKVMKSRGELDQDQRREISEMLDRGERLRRKIRGESENDDDGEDDESEEEIGEGAIQRIKANAFEELAGLDDESAREGEAEGGKKGKNIFEMKFMKDAMARDQQKVREMADDFAREMGDLAPDEDAELAELGEEARTYGTAVERLGGRVTYRPGASSDTVRPLGSLASDTSSVTLKSTDLPGEALPESPRAASTTTVTPAQVQVAEESNPWLAPRTGELSKAVQKRHDVVVSKNSGTADKSRHKLYKRTQKGEGEKEKTRDEATLDIEMSNVMTLASGSGPAGAPKKQATTSATKSVQPSGGSQAVEDSDSDANSEVEQQEKLLDRKGKAKANGVTAFEQRELVALAFAGDNVVKDFAEQKHREMQEDAPREVDTTLPGWGSWGGKGAKKAPLKPHLIKKVAGIDPSSRADYKKAHVIISEKRDKKAAKYMVKDLPYPYTSKAQFERSLDTPVGIEWNTRVGFQRATLPRVVKKMGTVISPLEKLQ